MFSPHTHSQMSRHEVMDVLISLIVIIISQCIYISDHHVVHLNCIQFLSVNYTSLKLGKARLQAQRHRRWQLEGGQETAVGRPGAASACGVPAAAEIKHFWEMWDGQTGIFTQVPAHIP